jgi:hypothetical protein
MSSESEIAPEQTLVTDPESQIPLDSELEQTAAVDEQAYLSQLHDLKQQERAAFANPPEREELPSTYVNGWSLSGPLMAVILFVSLLVVGVVAQRSLNYWAPHQEVPKYGVVVGQPAAVSPPTPAYPTVMVQPGASASQAPSPLPPTPAAKKKSFF